MLLTRMGTELKAQALCFDDMSAKDGRKSMWSKKGVQQIRLGIFAGVALLATLGVLASTRSTSGGASAAIPTATASDLSPDQHRGPPSVAPVYPYPPGVPAIAVKSATGPGPNFTVADVAAYVSTHLMAYQTQGSAPKQLVRAEFLTTTEVSQRLQGAYVARPPGTLMCIAYVHGDFTVTARGTTGKYVTAHYTEAWQLFDAVTGNLLPDAVTGNWVVESP
jgi:hypothetical protein